MKIGFDIDGTITTPDNLVPLVREYFKRDFNYEYIIHYDMEKVLGISRDELLQFFKDSHEGIIINPKMMEGSVKLINRLIEEGHEIYLITARHNSTKEDTIKWIKKEGINLDNNRVHFIGSHHKEYLIEELGLDIYVDDRLETLIEVDKHLKDSFNIKLILIDAPYNRFKIDDDIPIIRVESYKEIEKEIYGNDKGM